VLGVTALEGAFGACTDPERRGTLPRERLWSLETWRAGASWEKAPETLAKRMRSLGDVPVLPGQTGDELPPGGASWPAALPSQRPLPSGARPGVGQPIGKGSGTSCRPEPFPGSPSMPAPAAASPGLGAIPGAAVMPLVTEKHWGSKGSCEQGGLGKKCELCSCPVSSCFSLSVWGRCPGVRAVRGWGEVQMELEEQQRGQAGRAL